MPTSPLSPPPPAIRRVAVVGAGTMGAAIAAHLTNAGIPTVLLDQPAADGNAPSGRNALVQAGVERALRARPPAFMDPATTSALLTLGNTSDDLGLLADCDWIIEAIVERPAAKQHLWALVEAHARPDALFSSNSSGIPMAVQSQGRGEAFRRRFLGAHFYNPPRYLYLLELIPTADTAPEALETVRAFGDRVLGKGIVLANDVPGFIGNRIGIYSLLQTARVAEEMGLSADSVDALTGPLLGRPRSGTMRLADTVGLDVLGLISQDLSAATTDNFRLPPTMQRLLNAGRKGEKTGGGYYQRRKNADGTSTILVLDPATLDYAERPPADLPAIKAIARQPLPERLRALLALDTPAGEFTRRTLCEMLRFSAEKLGVVANTAPDIDHAQEWGFGWEMGPFKTIDAVGADTVVAVLEKLGSPVPPALAQHAREGTCFYPAGTEGAAESQREPGLIVLSDLKRAEPARVINRREGASLVDLGDGVLGLEFHSKANALGADAFAAVAEACDRVPTGFVGLVIGNQGRWFSAGADLGALLADAEGGNTAAVTAMIVNFQTMTTRLRAASFPVVAAPFGMTLGGGCETMLYSDAVQADAELTTGLVELKVGLMPSAGGTTEMLARANAALAPGADPYEALRATWGLITSGQTSASALEARRLGYLRAHDGITMNRRRLLGDAKDALLGLAAAGYQPPAPREIEVLGADGYARLMEEAHDYRDAGKWSDYDVHLAGELARLLTGGGPGVAAGRVPEKVLLDLEREVFIGLCAQPGTHERIRHMLKTGKPLRN